MPGHCGCKPSVSKHSQICLSSPFPVCAGVDLIHMKDTEVCQKIVYV